MTDTKPPPPVDPEKPCGWCGGKIDYSDPMEFQKHFDGLCKPIGSKFFYSIGLVREPVVD